MPLKLLAANHAAGKGNLRTTSRYPLTTRTQQQHPFPNDSVAYERPRSSSTGLYHSTRRHALVLTTPADPVKQTNNFRKIV